MPRLGLLWQWPRLLWLWHCLLLHCPTFTFAWALFTFAVALFTSALAPFAFALALLGGASRGIAVMQVFFGTQFDLTDRVWWQLSLRWGLFLLAAGTANEIAWRNLTDDGWVMFRVFVMAPATGLFMLAQWPLTLRGLQTRQAERLAAQTRDREHGKTQG